jgi:transposase-like protein
MPKLTAPRETVSGPADDRTCLSQGMGDKGTVEAFRAHLLAVHVNPLTGRSLSRRVASNTISRLRRIERAVGGPIQLADIDDVLSRLKGFPGVCNAKTALRHWRTFLGGGVPVSTTVVSDAPSARGPKSKHDVSSVDPMAEQNDQQRPSVESPPEAEALANWRMLLRGIVEERTVQDIAQKIGVDPEHVRLARRRFIRAVDVSEASAIPVEPPVICPYCDGDAVLDDGVDGTGRPKYLCKTCGSELQDDTARVVAEDWLHRQAAGAFLLDMESGMSFAEAARKTGLDMLVLVRGEAAG